MERSTKRILTTHAGSLPRPKALTAMHSAKSRGEIIEEAELERAVEEATRAVIERQIDAGVDIINNGEVGRESFFTYVRHRMTGFAGTGSRPVMADLLRYPGYIERLAEAAVGKDSVSLLAPPKAVGEISYSDPSAIERECQSLARLLRESSGRYTEAFVSSPSPGIVAAAMKNEHYPDLSAYVEAVARALRTEYEAIVRAGFLLQLDAPDLAMERHTLFQDKPLEEYLEFVRLVVGAINGALIGIPRDRVRLHVCWGNYEGPHDLDVPLAEIWPEVLRLEAGAYMISMANPRHAHEVRLFEAGILPENAVLIPGVLDTTTNYIEHPLAVAERIVQAATAVGDPRRIIAGTDCGFETAAGFGPVSPDVAWAKLRALSEGASIASKRLFG